MINMTFQIKGVENENNKIITITGYSESLKSFFKVKLTELSKNELNLDKEVNEEILKEYTNFEEA